MSLVKRKYAVVGYKDVYVMTDKQLCERVVEDSKRSNYNWIAPVEELVRLCKAPGFSEEYANTIKIAIVNCYANFERAANRGADRYIMRGKKYEAVKYCYNSLYGVESEEAAKARKSFLTETVMAASYFRVFSSEYHSGPTYQKLREDWVKSKVEEYISKEDIDFKELEQSLRKEFIEVVKKAEANGDFKEDDEKEKEEERRLIAKIINSLN